MRRPTFIARQAAHPTGFLGRVLTRFMAVETRRFNAEVLERLAIASGQRVLEIGFGHGDTLRRAAISHPDARFAGIDHAEDMVNLVGRRCSFLVREGRLDLRVGTSASLPWSNESFDRVFSVHTVYFWEHVERHMSEIYRVLVPGGRVVLGFRAGSDAAKKAFPDDVYTFRSPEEIANLLQVAGLVPNVVGDRGSDLRIVEGARP
jgi:ubiquinone/menaquinone biosynthesis C-methylase UbiE